MLLDFRTAADYKLLCTYSRLIVISRLINYRLIVRHYFFAHEYLDYIWILSIFLWLTEASIRYSFRFPTYLEFFKEYGLLNKYNIYILLKTDCQTNKYNGGQTIIERGGGGRGGEALLAIDADCAATTPRSQPASACADERRS
jgi:hypothetical protein